MNERETEEVKKQLLKQLESLQVENKEQIIQAVKSMNSEQLENFLKQNKIQYQKTGKASKEECPFCLILQGKIPAYKIDENKKSLAILEINPLSKGHALVISKEHKKLPSSAFMLASKIGKRIKSKMKAEEIKIENAQILGHHLINIIPLYKNQKLEKKKADDKELILLQDKLVVKKKEKKKKVKELKQELEKAPVRIP